MGRSSNARRAAERAARTGGAPEGPRLAIVEGGDREIPAVESERATRALRTERDDLISRAAGVFRAGARRQAEIARRLPGLLEVLGLTPPAPTADFDVVLGDAAEALQAELERCRAAAGIAARERRAAEAQLAEAVRPRTRVEIELALARARRAALDAFAAAGVPAGAEDLAAIATQVRGAALSPTASPSEREHAEWARVEFSAAQTAVGAAREAADRLAVFSAELADCRRRTENDLAGIGRCARAVAGKLERAEQEIESTRAPRRAEVAIPEKEAATPSAPVRSIHFAAVAAAAMEAARASWSCAPAPQTARAGAQ